MSREIEYINIEFYGYENTFTRQILIDKDSFNDDDVIALVNLHINNLVKELRCLANV